MERTKFIAGNWKMYKTTAEARKFALEFSSVYRRYDVKTAICAPFTQLSALKECFGGSKVGVGAQNVHFADEGAYTGEISLPMLKEIGVDYCIIGHSERRQYFNETDETVNLKLRKILGESDITPILCVGEHIDERRAGIHEAIVRDEVNADLANIDRTHASRIVIAYEPIWAIGTGETATPEQAQEMCAYIRGVLKGLYDEGVSEQAVIQYGGSVKPANAAAIMGMPDIDGALVGGASLDARSLNAIVEAAAER